MVVTSMDPPTEPQTWHYGVVARWWAEVNTSGPEIEYFQPYIEEGRRGSCVAGPDSIAKKVGTNVS